MKCSFALFGAYTTDHPLKPEIQAHYIYRFGLYLTGGAEKIDWLLLFSEIIADYPENQIT
jgi:hypothetical protein